MKVITQRKWLRFHPIVEIVNYNLIMALSKIGLPASICDQLRVLLCCISNIIVHKMETLIGVEVFVVVGDLV